MSFVVVAVGVAVAVAVCLFVCFYTNMCLHVDNHWITKYNLI